MGFRRAVVWFFAIAALCPAVGRADDYLMDLGTHPGGEVTVTIASGRIRVVVFHRVPGRKYSVTIVKETITIPPLPVSAAGVPPPENLRADPDCVAIQKGIDEVGTPADEIQVRNAAISLQRLLETVKGCPGPLRQNAENLRQTYDEGLPLPQYDVALGQQLRVTVARLSDAGAEEKKWTTILVTGPRGEWLTTYGMSFVLIRDELFYTKAGDKQGEFVITKMRPESISRVKYLPSVLFSWMPASRQNKALVVSPTAGFGVSNDSFGVLGGATITYNTNLGFTAGVAVSRQRKLLGSYTENQVVKENLTEEALHHDVLVPAGFLSITFRFGSNPFKSGGDDGKGGGKGDATPAGDKSAGQK
jgi:hypothetical protein